MATTNLADGAQATVAAAITAAAAGDILVVPAGSWTWASGVTISKALTLQGQSTPAPASPAQGPGISTTNITRSVKSSTFPLITINITTDLAIRVTGFNFDNNAGAAAVGNNTPVVQAICSDTVPARQIRIDNCTINTGTQVVWFIGGCYGLVEHVAFKNCWIGVILYGGSTDSGNKAWARADYQAGSLNFPFIENCTFLWNITSQPGSPWVLFHQQGARSVFRYNTIDSTAAPNGTEGPIDCHGSQTYWVGIDNDFRGTIRVEFYNNTVKLGNNAYRMMDLRGGSHLIHDNVVTTKDSGNINLGDCRDEEDDPANNAGLTVRSPVTWPCEDQITATFCWNNTFNGVSNNPLGVGVFGNTSATVGDPFYIKVNRDFWLKAPDATTTTVYPPPPNGPTIAGYPSPYALLQTTSYTPAAYPHPLSGGSGGGGGMAAFDPSMTINTLLGQLVAMDAQHTTELTTTTNVAYYENVMQINWLGGSRLELRVSPMSKTPSGVRLKNPLPHP